jgi:PmbA protein
MEEFDILDEITELALTKVKNTPLEGLEVFASVSDHSLTRYANNVIHQQVHSRDVNFRLKGYIGKKVASIGGAVTLDEVEDYIENLVSIVQKSPETSFFQGFLEPKPYETLQHNLTAIDSDERADIVNQAVKYGESITKDAKLFGKVESMNYYYRVKNHLGVNAKHAFSFNDFKVLSIVEEGENRGYGREIQAFKNPKELNVEDLAKSAIQISQDTFHAKSIDVGEYEVVLRPQATIELLMYSLIGLGADAYHQSNSPYSDRLGEQLMDASLTVRDLPIDNRTCLTSPFDGEGTPKSNKVIIENGVPKQVFHTSMSASEYLDDKNLTSGFAGIPYSDYGGGYPGPMNLVTDGGNSSESEMIEETKKGLLVQTFWYSNPVNMPKGVITGLSRDGLYLIEDGEIKGAVKNMRYTDSFLSFFNKIDLISKKQHHIFPEWGADCIIPMMKLNKLKFTSQSKH